MPLYLGRLYRAILKESRTLQEADEKFDAAVSDLLITEAKRQSEEAVNKYDAELQALQRKSERREDNQ